MDAFKRAVGVISPLVIFILIQYLVTFLATLTFMNTAVDPEAVLNQAQTLELRNAAYEMLNNNVVLISGIASVISIPIFQRMLNREWMKRPYRLEALKPIYKKYIYVALAAIGMTVAFNLGVNAFELFRYDVDYAQIARGIYSEPFYLQILVIGFLMPVSEELMFRGLVFERISNYGSETAGVIITSLIFGFYNGTMIQIAYAFVFSLFMKLFGAYCFSYRQQFVCPGYESIKTIDLYAIFRRYCYLFLHRAFRALWIKAGTIF